MRCTAPEMAKVPPLVSASLVLVGKSRDIAGGHMQTGCTGFECAQHDAVARQDDAAQKAAVAVDRFHSDRRAHHHHHARARRTAGQQALACADHGHPAVGAQARRVVVAVAQPRFGSGGDHPLRLRVPQLVELFRHAPFHGVTRHHAAQHPAGGSGSALQSPSLRVSMFSRNCAPCANSFAPRPGGFVHSPLQAGVANVERQKCHARIIPARRRGNYPGLWGIDEIQFWRQGKPWRRQPPRLPRWASPSGSPSKPSRML